MVTTFLLSPPAVFAGARGASAAAASLCAREPSHMRAWGGRRAEWPVSRRGYIVVRRQPESDTRVMSESKEEDSAARCFFLGGIHEEVFVRCCGGEKGLSYDLTNSRQRTRRPRDEVRPRVSSAPRAAAADRRVSAGPTDLSVRGQKTKRASQPTRRATYAGINGQSPCFDAWFEWKRNMQVSASFAPTSVICRPSAALGARQSIAAGVMVAIPRSRTCRPAAGARLTVTASAIVNLHGRWRSARPPSSAA